MLHKRIQNHLQYSGSRVAVKGEGTVRASRGRVFVAMSGGVDSSVAALLLKGQGYDVVGVFMRCFSAKGGSASRKRRGSPEAAGRNAHWCTTERDAEDARRVSEKLDIPFYVWDFEEEYRRKIIDYMIEGYRQGETPNPDVMCNREIKFGLFLNRALEMGADYVATGHYMRLARSVASRNRLSARSSDEPQPALSARTTPPLAGTKLAAPPRASSKQSTSPTCALFMAKDTNKDQSYFLWTLKQKQLAHCLFPIGDYIKTEVREIARKSGLPTADKKDSQGICFLGQVTLADFLAEYLPERRGEIRAITGEKIGEHRGAHFYTIGQRRGFGGGGGTPYYVSEKDVETNILVVAPSATDESLYQKEIELTDVNFINPSIIYSLSSSPLSVLARVRYRQPLAPAKLYHLKPNIYHIEFDAPVKFVAPGQSAVFYKTDGEILGGGVIC